MRIIDLINEFIVHENEIQVKFLAKLDLCKVLSKCGEVPEIQQAILMLMSNLVIL